MSDATIASETAEVDHAVHDDHGADQHGDHPTEKAYWIIFAVLGAFTALEIAWSYMGLEGMALVLPLIAMMVIKFVLVAGIFMHLKYDLSIRNGNMFTFVFAFGLVLALAVFVSALLTFTTRS